MLSSKSKAALGTPEHGGHVLGWRGLISVLWVCEGLSGKSYASTGFLDPIARDETCSA